MILERFAANRRASRLLWTAVIFANLAFGPASHAAVEYQRLKSFGYPDLSGANPSGPLIQGSDGAFYGAAGGGEVALGAVFKLNMDGGGYRVLHWFNPPGDDGKGPVGSLLEGSDGVLYGTTASVGNTNAGIFRLNKDGTGYKTLHRFAWPDGRDPGGGLIEGSDGALYGTTSPGANTMGTIFKLNKDGSGYSVLHNFSWTGGDGWDPRGTLVEGNDGALYGTTSYGGNNAEGTVFKLKKDGSAYEVLFSFNGSDGSNPFAGLIEGSDGALYGTTLYGGSKNLGTVFKLNKDGSGHEVLHDGLYPAAGLLEGSDGALYGTTGGDLYAAPTVFKVNKNGSGYSILHGFGTTPGDGLFPQFGLVEGTGGALYGTTPRGGRYSEGTVFKLNADGSDYSILHNFSVTGGDGSFPRAGLLEGSDGALYGTTTSGGSEGMGTLFKVSKDGTGYTHLWSFGGSGGGSGSGLIEGSDGALYGTTAYGGGFDSGTVFKINKDASGFTVLHSFRNSGGDGRQPSAGVVEGSDGALYGTTPYGGTNRFGTVFKLSKDGSGYQILHNFASSPDDGRGPAARLLEGSDGALYGTTVGGGSLGQLGAGTIFALNKDGANYSVIHRFDIVGGDQPYAGLIEGSDGMFYGTTKFGGAATNDGTVFRLSRDGSNYQVLHTFSRDRIDGREPQYGLVEGRDGALYGSTTSGGSNNLGTVFRVSRDGNDYSVLYAFRGSSYNNALFSEPDGAFPAALALGSDGAFYSVAAVGGDLGLGTVFRLLVNHPPVAVARAFPLISFSPSDTNGFVISLNNTDALVYFDASQSSDADNDPLQFFWSEEGLNGPFAVGVMATNRLGVGTHDIILVVSDGYDAVTDHIALEVVTAGQAVSRLADILIQAQLSEQQAHSLLVSLNAASAFFDRGNPAAALTQLQTFQRKVRAQVCPAEPSLAETLIQGAQKIIDSFDAL